jgi:hypothetical protein
LVEIDAMDPYSPPDDLDFDNPYAPPKTSYTPEVAPVSRDFAAIPFTFESIMSRSWSIFKENLGACLWVSWGVVLINMALGFVLGLLLRSLQVAMAGDERSFMLVNFAVNLVSFIIQAWLTIGMNRGLIKIVRGEPLSFDVLFSGGKYLVTMILASILVGCLLFAAAIVPILVMSITMAALRGNLSAPGGLFVLAGCGLFVVLILYLAARLMQFYFLVIDRDAGVIDSIGFSWQITRGRAGTIILVYLMQLVLILAGILAFCVGLIFTVPLSSLLMVVTYLAAVGPVKPQERVPLLRWEEDL